MKKIGRMERPDERVLDHSGRIEFGTNRRPGSFEQGLFQMIVVGHNTVLAFVKILRDYLVAVG